MAWPSILRHSSPTMKVPVVTEQRQEEVSKQTTTTTASAALPNSGLAAYGRLSCSMSWRNNSCFEPESSKGGCTRDSSTMMEVLRSKRAFDLLCLTMKDESETESESSDSDVFSEADLLLEDDSTSPSGRTRRVSVSVENLKAFQSRMAQLEYMVRQQDTKIVHLETTVDQQVELRTRKAAQAMEEKLLAMQEQQEAEIERRVAERLESKSSQKQNTKQRRSSKAEKLLSEHISIQEKQLAEARQLLEVAMEDRDQAAATAREAMELTLRLDSKLDTAQSEIDLMQHELLRYSCPGYRTRSSNGVGGALPLITKSRQSLA